MDTVSPPPSFAPTKVGRYALRLTFIKSIPVLHIDNLRVVDGLEDFVPEPGSNFPPGNVLHSLLFSITGCSGGPAKLPIALRTQERFNGELGAPLFGHVATPELLVVNVPQVGKDFVHDKAGNQGTTCKPKFKIQLGSKLEDS